MVRVRYTGLGQPEHAAQDFDALAPYALEMVAMRAECIPFGADWAAMGIALDGLESCAYHFTQNLVFRRLCEVQHGHRPGNGRLGDRREAIAAFEALAPCVTRLRALQSRCRPLRRDYLAIDIAIQSLETAAFHFTRVATFYGSRMDSAGPVRPPI
jgi:hypothetical protein